MLGNDTDEDCLVRKQFPKDTNQQINNIPVLLSIAGTSEVFSAGPVADLHHLAGSLAQTLVQPRSPAPPVPSPALASALQHPQNAAGIGVFGGISVGTRDQEGYWVHPAIADASIHAGARRAFPIMTRRSFTSTDGVPGEALPLVWWT